MAGPNSSFLDPLLSPTHQDNGVPLTRRANINLIGFTVADNPTTDATDITNTGGGGAGSVIALTDHAAFRALSSVADKTVIHFQSPPGTYVYSSSSGAGFADDDNIVLKLTAISTGAAGRAYNAGSSVLPTYAAYRLIGSLGLFTSYDVLARTSFHDGGGGLFAYDPSDTTSSDDDGVTLVSGTKRAKRVFAGPRHAEWFGVRADGRDITDGVLSAGANTFSSAMAGFSLADEARKMLLRMPSHPSTHPVTLTSFNNVFTGTGLNTDFAILPGSGVPRTGGGIVCLQSDAGAITYRAVLAIVTDGSAGLLYTYAPDGVATNKTLYLETQAEVYVKYVSSTQVTLWSDQAHTAAVNAVFSETSVPAFIATDDDAARDSAVNAVVAARGTLTFPPGQLGYRDNGVWSGARNVHVYGAGRDATVWRCLRPASYERASADVAADGAFGAMSFVGPNSDNVHIWDMSVDHNVHVVGVAHTTGGIVNNSGGRIGFFMRNVTNPGFHRLGSNAGIGHYGARDEHIYFDTGCTNWKIEDCVLGSPTYPTNGPSMNPVDGDGGKCVDNVAWSHFSALECSSLSPIITGNHLGNYAIYPIGAEIVICSARGRITFCHNQLLDSDLSASGVAAVIFDSFGHVDYTNSVLICSDNLFSNIKGIFGPGADDSAKAGLIHINGFTGTAYVTNNVGDNIRSTASYPNGRFLNVTGAGTSGKIFVGGNVLNPNPASGEHYMGVGVEVDEDVPRGVVVMLPGNYFTGCPIPFNIQTGADTPSDLGEMLRGEDIRDRDTTIFLWDNSGTFSVNASTNVVTGPIQYTDQDAVYVHSTIDLPAPLLESVKYYVRDVSGDNCKLARTPGGAVIDITTAGSGVLTITRPGGNRYVVPEATLTSNRVVVLMGADESGAAENADVVRVERRDRSAHTLAIYDGATLLYTFPSGKNGAADFRWNSTGLGAWEGPAGKTRLVGQ